MAKRGETCKRDKRGQGTDGFGHAPDWMKKQCVCSIGLEHTARV